MPFKKFLILNLQIYCLLVTLILAVSAIFGCILAPEDNLHYYQLAGPFVVAGACVLPSFITYFKKEPTPAEFIIRNVIQLAVIEAIVMFMIQPPAEMNGTVFYVILGSAVMLIFAATKFIAWLQKYRESKTLTEQLRKLQTSEQ